MTITFRPDPRHAAVTSCICPRCGARRDELRPCGECGTLKTWQQAHHEAIARGYAMDAVNAILEESPEDRAAMVRRLHRQFAEMQGKCEPPRCANAGAAQTSHNACVGESQGIRK